MSHKWADPLRIIAFIYPFAAIAWFAHVGITPDDMLSTPVRALLFLVVVVGPTVALSQFAQRILATRPVTTKEACELIRAWGKCIEESAGDTTPLRLPAPLSRMKQAFRVVTLQALKEGDDELLRHLSVGYPMMARAGTREYTQRMAMELDFMREWSELIGDPESPGDIAASVIRAADSIAAKTPLSSQDYIRKGVREDIRRAAQEDT